MCQVKASANFHGQELSDISVINPGGWFGKTWLIEIGGSYSSLYLVVEADSMSDAIDELADDEKHGHHIVVEDEYLSDYDPESCHYGPSGQVLDLDHIMIYGQEVSATPFPCRYSGGCITDENVAPTEFECECD
ncbi:hypothetical protein [Rubripirellula reticaptiva]|uniref:Uncharacterized protein n=1 Tax=Rubripirellula reticaptiva TaxID=2528013 RepID=A0A5C6EHN7_9BACT|nr:hypothetical protein [Rubripirellula reticaptiva]TWU49293.1 hypothetical protein Poly59_39070 [Rubripirellula reticaptiva]